MARWNLVIFLLWMGGVLWGRGVPAGTKIVNTAQLSYKISDKAFRAQSNTLSDTVDQVVALDMSCQESGVVEVQKGEKGRAVRLLLTNVGNGMDHYLLVPDTNASPSDLTDRHIWLDNGDGLFSPSTDREVYDLNLSADHNATLFLVGDIPSDATWHTTSYGIKAVSTLVPSTQVGDARNLGRYFVVNGMGGGVDSGRCGYRIVTIALKLEKEATLSSPQLYIGSKIHYRIKASVVGVGTLEGVSVTDTIPQGTSYLPNSLRVDGKVLNDDATYLHQGKIIVPLGRMRQTPEQHPVHTVAFDVVVE